MGIPSLRLTVYVRSVRVQTGEKLVEDLYPVKRPGRLYEISKDTVYKVKFKKTFSYVLPDDQKTLVEVLKQASEQGSIELKVVDVARENVVLRLWRRLRGIKNFPFVETNSGGKLQAPFSQSDLEKFISQSVVSAN